MAVSGTSEVDVSGGMVKVTSDGQLDMSSSGIATLKGASPTCRATWSTSGDAMSERDDFDRAFTEELSALDAFFDRRAEAHEHFKLGRQDPDVRRILEAVAFFSARTRQLAAANVREAVERLARGQLDDLLAPVPAAGTLLALVDEGLGGPAMVPEGTEVQLTAPDRSIGVFTTRRRLDVLPLRLTALAAPPSASRLCCGSTRGSRCAGRCRRWCSPSTCAGATATRCG